MLGAAAYCLLGSITALALCRYDFLGTADLLLLLFVNLVALLSLQRRWSRLVLWVLAAVWLSFHFYSSEAALWPDARHGEEVSFSATISELVEWNAQANVARVVFTTDELGRSTRLRLNWRKPPKLTVGQRWQVTAKLFRPSGFRNLGTFNFRLWAVQENISATGYIKQAEPVGGRQWLPITKARENLRAQFARTHAEAAPLLSALVLGDRSGLSAGQWQALQATGAGHLFSISGLHIGIVAMLAYWLTLLVWRVPALLLRVPRPYASAVAALVAALAYAALAGFSTPTVRALIMIAAFGGAVLLARRTTLASSLGLSVMLVILLTPLSIMSPGFWLSFAAVALLIWVLGNRKPAYSWWQGLLVAQLAISVGLLPLTSYFFGGQSYLSLIANLLLVPLFSFVVVPLSLLGTLLLQLGWDGPVVLAGDVLLHTLEMLAWLGQAGQSYLVVVSVGLLALACVGAFIMLGPMGIGWHWRLVGLAMFAPALVSPYPRLEAGELQLTMFDVGHGLAVLVQVGDHALLYDTGARFRSGTTAAEIAVIPSLRHLGVRQLDALVISHDDLDHAGGLGAIVAAFDPSLIYAEAGCAGQWHWGGVGFAFIQPTPAAKWGDNDRSCVLEITHPKKTILLTGDIEKAAEKALLAQGIGAADIITVPHHGSNSSSHQAFVEQLRPQYALVSTSYRNHWRFPRPEVVQRYQQVGATVLNTGELGMIRLKVDRKGDISVAILPTDR